MVRRRRADRGDKTDEEVSFEEHVPKFSLKFAINLLRSGLKKGPEGGREKCHGVFDVTKKSEGQGCRGGSHFGWAFAAKNWAQP